MNRKIRSTFILTAIVAPLIAIAMFIWLYPFPKQIDAEYPAFQFRDHKALSAEKTSMRIQGVLYRPLFRGEKFSGTIGNIQKVHDFEKVKITVYEPIGGQEGSSTDLFIAAPAKTFEEAQNIASANAFSPAS